MLLFSKSLLHKRNGVLGIVPHSAIFFLMKGAFLIDAPVRSSVLHVEGDGWDHSTKKSFVAAVSHYGDWPELMLLGGVGFFLARRVRNRKWQRVFLVAMMASTLAGTVVNTLRLTTGRTRPRVGPPIEQGWYGPLYQGKCLIGAAEFNSFPSGHTATAVGFATVICFASLPWGVVAMMLAAAIASSRMLLGAHHPSDLLGATILALGVVWCCWFYFYHQRCRWLEQLIKG